MKCLSNVAGSQGVAVTEIKNFFLVLDGLATAGQPTVEQLREVAADRYRMVINLGLLDQPYSLPDEAGVVASLGLKYRHIPVKFDAPSIDDFAAFLVAMDEHAGDRMFVHCAANYRVSSFVSLYGELRLGWTRTAADSHARRFWDLDPVWARFLVECRETYCVVRG